ncbi:hypothetical protein CAPTEDRAFT_218049 [Capitella teleta]|uniref:Uncharacterized protein n=1 Tax=Capitella teleta TaxID=283909 RepID=R7THI8_CAPTE|nr:hypothetical protein CAPTEDRAFT_218049 [Capitella teleta]|eukprot:ELT92912.1 hypothetical protein CAPTEDRAFT_218049 [Capitella teleta]
MATVNHFFRILQHADICFANVQSGLSDALAALHSMKEHDGQNLKASHKCEIQKKELFQGFKIETQGRQNLLVRRSCSQSSSKDDLLNQLIENLEARFVRVDLLDAMKARNLKIFVPTFYPIKKTYWSGVRKSRTSCSNFTGATGKMEIGPNAVKL